MSLPNHTHVTSTSPRRGSLNPHFLSPPSMPPPPIAEHPRPPIYYHYPPPSALTSQFNFGLSTHHGMSMPPRSQMGGPSDSNGSTQWSNRDFPHDHSRKRSHTQPLVDTQSFHTERRMSNQPYRSDSMIESEEWRNWKRESQPQAPGGTLSFEEQGMRDRNMPPSSDPAGERGMTQMAASSLSEPKRVKKRPRITNILKSEQASGSSAVPKPLSYQEKPFIPSVLTREKKQKACSNCRKAKLKCMVEAEEGVCVRCKSRKEKCIFFPKGYDEDWQQLLQSDVYAATSHLAQLSSVVEHILHHLVSENIIPPMSPPFEAYEPPDREGMFLGLEKKDSIEEEANEKKRKKRKESKDGNESGSGGTLMTKSPNYPEPASASAGPPYPEPSSTVYQSQSASNNGPESISRSEKTILASPSARLGPTKQPFNLLPPIPSSDDIPLLQNGSGDSPASLLTPSSRISSSPRQGASSGRLPPVQSITQYSDSGYRQEFPNMGAQRHMTSSMRDEPHLQQEAEGEFEDENGIEIILGSRDPRQDIVKKNIVRNRDALVLVNYFHSHLSGFLYGYRLQFRRFPYLEGGPSTITPLILAVLSYVSCERFSQYLHYRTALVQEVLELLETSPAESWQRFEGTQAKDFGDVEADDPLDAEFGLGPEEIVAACVLATYMTERREGALIARSAFRWARGWIKLLSSTPPRVTLAETAGFVPPERQASAQDMARVWLLCYIVDSTERLQILDMPAPLSRDALSYCNLLIPPSSSPTKPVGIPQHYYQDEEDRPDPHDILLTSHARLMTIFNEWRHKHEQILPGTDAADADQRLFVTQLKRLAGKVNGELEWWNEGYQSVKPNAASDLNDPLQREDRLLKWRYTEMTWLFIKMHVNSTVTKALAPSTPMSAPATSFTSKLSSAVVTNSSDFKLREASRSLVVDCALEILEICRLWVPREDITNFGPTYLYFITLAGSELVSAFKEGGGEGVIGLEELISLLTVVGGSLHMGELHSQHVVRTTGSLLFHFCDELHNMKSWER